MIDDQRLRAWVVGAPPGGSLVLGRGDRLPPLLGAAVRGLAEAQVIDPVRRRVSPGVFEFVAQRRSGVFSGLSRSQASAAVSSGLSRRQADAAVSSGLSRRQADAAREQALVRSAVMMDIKWQRPCRTNAELARDLGIARGAARVSALLRRVVAAGDLSFDHYGPLERRVAVDPATGRRTPRGSLPVTRPERVVANRVRSGWLARSPRASGRALGVRV